MGLVTGIRRTQAVAVMFVAAIIALTGGRVGSAQSTRPVTPDTQPGNELVGLNLPENAPLKVLLDYVSQEFGLNILYEETVAGQRVTIKAPARMPKSAVIPLLESVLKMRGLAMVDADQPGWKRIIPLAQAAAVPATGPAVEALKPAAAVVQVFKLQYAADAKAVDTLVKPFLTTPGASSFPLPDQGLLVVTDYASNLKRVADLIQSVDQPNQDVNIEFIAVKHADPGRLTQQVDQLLKAKVRTQGGGDRLAQAVETTYDARTNQVVVIAPRDRMADAREIVRSLDTPVTEAQSPIRFYKLANTTAAEVLATIRSLEGEEESPQTAGPAGSNSRTGPRKADYPAGGATSGSAGRPREQGTATPSIVPPQSIGARASGDVPAAGTTRTPGGAADSTGTTPPTAGSSPTAPVREALRTKTARVTADPHTNSIIVVGPPDVQRLYEQLIKALDKRRPQVLVECTIVTLDTTNNLSVGVELGTHGPAGTENQVITFSNFGLSTPDPKTGQLSLVPGVGFNGAIVNSKLAEVVIKALNQESRARVSSAPRILVNDNNVGTLSSIAEFPYASVNASNTVATTSFGDYAQAGTEITVTPHISESDYLQLEYTVSLSSFTGQPITQGGTTLPPPRKSDSVQSQVTIPDGATIIVGGLNRQNYTRQKDSVPILGRIPILEYLFSSRQNSEGNSTLFVFIRPVILRDDKFADLKFLSEQDVRAAEVPPDLPASEPMTMR